MASTTLDLDAEIAPYTQLIHTAKDLAQSTGFYSYMVWANAAFCTLLDHTLTNGGLASEIQRRAEEILRDQHLPENMPAYMRRQREVSARKNALDEAGLSEEMLENETLKLSFEMDSQPQKILNLLEKADHEQIRRTMSQDLIVLSSEYRYAVMPIPFLSDATIDRIKEPLVEALQAMASLEADHEAALPTDHIDQPKRLDDPSTPKARRKFEHKRDAQNASDVLQDKFNQLIPAMDEASILSFIHHMKPEYILARPVPSEFQERLNHLDLEHYGWPSYDEISERQEQLRASEGLSLKLENVLQEFIQRLYSNANIDTEYAPQVELQTKSMAPHVGEMGLRIRLHFAPCADEIMGTLEDAEKQICTIVTEGFAEEFGIRPREKHQTDKAQLDFRLNSPDEMLNAINGINQTMRSPAMTDAAVGLLALSADLPQRYIA